MKLMIRYNELKSICDDPLQNIYSDMNKGCLKMFLGICFFKYQSTPSSFYKYGWRVEERKQQKQQQQHLSRI